MRRIFWLTGIATIACSESNDTRSAPASVTAVAGNNQVAPAGTVLTESLAVIVRTASGDPAPGASVAWQTDAGSVSPAVVIAGNDGIARAAYTLGLNAGTHQATATVGALPLVTFSAVAQIQGATQMGNRSIGPAADSVLGTLTEFEQPLKVLVLDQNGVPVPGVVVQWSASGGGSVPSATGVTDAGGESIMEYTFGAEARGGYFARAAVPGLIGSPVDFELNAYPGNPVSLTKTSGDGVVAQVGGQVGHSVAARDSYGNGTQGVTIQWTAATGGGSITPAQNFTGNAGHAEATRTLGAGTGEQTATATAPALPGAPLVTFTTTAATTVVRVANNVFVGGIVTIQRGDSVAWQWQNGAAPHNITFAAAAGAPANEPDRTSGAVWRTFATAGTFNYQCTNHGGMTGLVTVNP